MALAVACMYKENVKYTVIIVIKIFHKMFPHKFFQFSLDGYDIIKELWRI